MFILQMAVVKGGGRLAECLNFMISQMIDGGVTTAIGCLGSNGITRSVESVLMKVKSIKAIGMSAWMYTGAYQVPPPTITRLPFGRS